MSVNRLADLHQGNNGNPSGGYEMRPLLTANGNINTGEGFLEQVDQVKGKIRQINEKVDKIRFCVNAGDPSKYRHDVDDYSNQSQSIMNQVKLALKDIEPKNGQTDMQTRMNAFKNVTESFIKAIKNHRDVVMEFQKKERLQLERQIGIANPNATPEQIEEAINKAEQGGGAVFAEQLLQTASGEYRRQGAEVTLNAVQERHKDIQNLTESVQELLSLFEEMELMLKNQSDSLKTIEYNAEETAGNLEQGVQYVEKATISAKATRRKKWICFCIFIVILIILAIVLGVTLAPKSAS